MDNLKNDKTKKIIAMLCCGLFIGFVNGFFGAGGGMICVPLLLLFGLENKNAHATAVLTMLPISIASSFVYYSNGFVNFSTILWVAIGSVLGGILGSLILKKISNKALSYIFAIIVVLVGIRMLF